MDDYLTSSEAAVLAGVGVSSIKRWVDDNRIRSTKTPGGHRRIARSELLRFLGNGHGPAESERSASDTQWADDLLSHDRHGIQARLFDARARLGSWARVMNEVGSGINTIGNRWKAGEVTVGDEHIATEMLDRALVSIHDMLPVSPTAPLCLLATAVGDLHTIGLSLCRVVLREAGWRTAWIGSMTPTDVLCEMIRRSRGSMVAISASRLSGDEQALALQVSEVSAACRETGATLVLGGAGAWPTHAPHALRFADFALFHEYLVRLR